MDNILRGVALSSIVAGALFVSGCSTGQDVAQKTQSTTDQAIGGAEQPPPPPPAAQQPPPAPPPATEPPPAETQPSGERG